MKKIWIFSIVALFFMGCEGFLDTENLTKKDNSNFPKTSGDAETALTGIYALLREMTPGEDGQGFFLTAELLSDDRFGGGGPDDRRMHAVDRLKKVDENMFSDVWKQDYRAIYRHWMVLVGRARKPVIRLRGKHIFCVLIFTSIYVGCLVLFLYLQLLNLRMCLALLRKSCMHRLHLI